MDLETCTPDNTELLKFIKICKIILKQMKGSTYNLFPSIMYIYVIILMLFKFSG